MLHVSQIVMHAWFLESNLKLRIHETKLDQL
jgi:hypothetical protein